ncbi:CBS domain-containing protein [Oceanobacter mangrovi]|uniref:CBS domain-containing protein n=1 Tax=Oceanobacter mangrovi TaxID=2862510 RepID=UPI001C8EC523|nr:CBS domain-containing protein [Oceanobacter mangrovi]
MTIIAFDMGLKVETPVHNSHRKVHQTEAISPSQPVRELEDPVDAAGRAASYQRHNKGATSSNVAADIMSSPVISISPDATIAEAWRLFQQHGIRQLPVVRDQQLQAMLYERTLLQHGFLEGGSNFQQFAASQIQPLLQRPVLCVYADTDLMTVAHLFAEQQVECVPVVNDSELVGLITRGDFIKAMAQQSGYSFWV